MKPEEMTPEEVYQEALRRIAVAREQRLTELNLTGLLLDRIPPELFELEWLTALRIRWDLGRSGKIQHLPAEFASFKCLQLLNISNHEISDLELLAGLTELQKLHCWGNQITDLAPLAGLSQLQSLDCWYNQLTDLGPLADLTQLQELECGNNPIRDLEAIKPFVLTGQLKRLGVYGNPVRSIPTELLGPGYVAEKLRAYWQELEQGAEPNRDVKVILIGNGCVGKTTLVYALRHRCRPPEPVIERTHGIVIDTLEWQIPGETQSIRMQLWDFGGQEIYHATHRLFLHHNALYLLLWAEETDEAPSETRHPAGYWSSLIHELAADSPVILVKNQIDRSDRLPRPADLDTSITFVQELKISALHYWGIETLRATISEQLLALKDRWSYLIPQSWLQLKEILSERRADKTLSRAHYAQLCIQHGVKHAATLLGYLHDSGFLFYRQDHFGDQLILDQNWIINIIYRLLDPAEHIRKRLIRQSGTFSGYDTGDFWREYSPEEREIFTDFMLNCEMAFTLDRQKDFNDQQFVLPALLPQMPPLGVKVWGAHQPGEWWLDFSYPFLHRALIERLIVCTARLSPDRDWWHDGILLSDDETGCQLLLQYQPESMLSQVIRLRIRGQQRSRAYARVSNLMAELHPHRQPQVFASLDGRHFVSLEILQHALQAGQMHVACRDGQIVDSQPYREFLYIENQKERFAMPEQLPPPVRIFISYAHEDETYKIRLEICLKGIKRQFNIDYWSDRQLFAGDRFEQTIFAKLKEADIVCLLISSDFIASDYCFNKEMEQALQQYEQNAGIPIPIIIRRTDEWYAHRIGQHTALPTDGKPLSQWRDPDDFWADVQQGIRRQVERIIEQQAERRP